MNRHPRAHLRRDFREGGLDDPSRARAARRRAVDASSERAETMDAKCVASSRRAVVRGGLPAHRSVGLQSHGGGGFGFGGGYGGGAALAKDAAYAA